MKINTHNQQRHAMRNDCLQKMKLPDLEAKEFFSQLLAITDMKIECLNKVFGI